jgi:hypothetical protein
MKIRKLFTAATLFVALAPFAAVPLSAQKELSTYKPSATVNQPFVIEYYYKAKWGHAEEFIDLLKEVELGRLLSVTATTPRYHTTEDGRWDFRVTIIFKNSAAANDDFDEALLARELYPDQVTYKREEQRRFEILDAHWDLPVKAFELKLHQN